MVGLGVIGFKTDEDKEMMIQQNEQGSYRTTKRKKIITSIIFPIIFTIVLNDDVTHSKCKEAEDLFGLETLTNLILGKINENRINLIFWLIKLSDILKMSVKWSTGNTIRNFKNRKQDTVMKDFMKLIWITGLSC